MGAANVIRELAARAPMRGARIGWLMATLAGLVMLSIGTAGAQEANLTIDIDAEGEASVEDAEGWIVAEDHEPPERYAWELSLDGDYQRANVTVADGFGVDRPRQLVPLFDDKHFVEVDDPASVDRAAQVYNLSQSTGSWSYALGLLGPAEANVTLERDEVAPGIEIADVGNVTEIGFDVTTDTDEAAEADLFVIEDGEVIQTYPTPRPGPWQHFPVQGLDANTSYEVYIEAEDWSGNTNRTETIEMRTGQEPNPPKPLVEPVRPEPNETVTRDSVVVEASFTEEGWPTVREDVKVFFDKERVDNTELEITEGTIAYRPDGSLEPRTYFVSVEVPNTAGGTGIARWSFDVQPDAARSAPGPVALISIVLAAGLLAVRRRP